METMIACCLTLGLWLKLGWEGKKAKLCGVHTMVWKGKKARVMWGTMIVTLFWVVWMKRNRRIFEDFVGAIGKLLSLGSLAVFRVWLFLFCFVRAVAC